MGPSPTGDLPRWGALHNSGGNDFSIDGIPNNANIRRISYSPHTDTVQEFKVETSNFDAAVGHTSGASFSFMTKAGTNQFHGSLSEQHWRNEWNAAGFFAKQTHYRQIAEAEGRGDTAAASALRKKNINPVGHSNNCSVTLGGPLILPRIYNGKDKLFFFFSYSGLKDRTAASEGYRNRTVPTMRHREGDFSDLLVVDAVRCQICDPLSVRPDPARPTHYIRDPFARNILPQSRAVTPVYKYYTPWYPVPNNNPLDPRREPTINYLAHQVRWLFDYAAYTGPIDHQHSDKHRFFGRTHYWTNLERNQDWLYETLPGLGELSGDRIGLGIGLDWIYTPSGAAVLNLSVGYQQFNDAVEDNKVRKIKPSAVGLPAYIDAKAGDYYVLPVVSPAGYDGIGRGFFGLPNRHRNGFAKLDASLVRGSHTVRAGFDQHQLYKSMFGFGAGAGLIPSGAFDFNNFFTRKNDDLLTPAGNLGHSWAAFMMGLPSDMSIGTYDSAALQNAMYGWYVQDGWRLTPKLTLNLGLRMEFELAPTERFNRSIGYFDPAAKLPITDAAQAAYARAPLRELSPAGFLVAGGSTYVGTGGVPRRFWDNELMFLPRIAAAYQLNPLSVLRAGYGIYYDTLNIRDFSYAFPNQLGYSRDTSTVLTNDFGMNFLVGDPRRGISPMTDPFPVRADGTRYNEPVRNQLGLMAVVGRSLSFFPKDIRRSRQQRWRLGFQRQIGASLLIDAGYAGSYSDRVYVTRNLKPLVEQYWADGLVRNNAIASDLNTNVSNPFHISNFASLQSSHPLVYQDMSTNSFFTSPTIRKNQLLRAYPHMSGLSRSYDPSGEVRTDALEVRVERRFSRGFNLNVAYTRMRGRAADFFFNEFDPDPTWRESGQTRPHRLTATSVVELPFGKGRPFANTGLAGRLFGGFQVSATYEFQPGPLLSFGNLFYYGNDVQDIKSGTRTLDRWFNTDNFERNASRAPAAFHRRVFPNHIDGLRGDMANIWSGNIQREFRFAERARLQVRFDALNLFNRTTFSSPDTNPLSTNFGRVLNQTATRNRYIQIQAKIRF